MFGPAASMNGGNDDDPEEWLQELITYNREAPGNLFSNMILVECVYVHTTQST